RTLVPRRRPDGIPGTHAGPVELTTEVLFGASISGCVRGRAAASNPPGRLLDSPLHLVDEGAFRRGDGAATDHHSDAAAGDRLTLQETDPGWTGYSAESGHECDPEPRGDQLQLRRVIGQSVRNLRFQIPGVQS